VKRLLGRSNSFFFKCTECGNSYFSMRLEERKSTSDKKSFVIYLVCLECQQVHACSFIGYTGQKGAFAKNIKKEVKEND